MRKLFLLPILFLFIASCQKDSNVEQQSITNDEQLAQRPDKKLNISKNSTSL
jgi:hypothetical protein